MDNASKALLESLQYRIPDIRSIYNLISINSGSSRHQEIDNIVSNFTDPSIIIAIGLITSCFIIQRESKSKFHVIDISQEAIYYKCNTGELRSNIVNVLRAKDFVPDPLVKKIVLVDSYNKNVTGSIYYEIYNNKYTDDSNAVRNFLDFSKSDLKSSFDIVNDYLKGIEWV